MWFLLRQKYLKEKDKLTPLQVKQLDYILFFAGNNPETAGDVVKKRIDATNAQTEAHFGFKYTMKDKPVTPNAIDGILRESTDLKERLA